MPGTDGKQHKNRRDKKYLETPPTAVSHASPLSPSSFCTTPHPYVTIRTPRRHGVVYCSCRNVVPAVLNRPHVAPCNRLLLTKPAAPRRPLGLRPQQAAGGSEFPPLFLRICLTIPYNMVLFIPPERRAPCRGSSVRTSNSSRRCTRTTDVTASAGTVRPAASSADCGAWSSAGSATARRC